MFHKTFCLATPGRNGLNTETDSAELSGSWEQPPRYNWREGLTRGVPGFGAVQPDRHWLSGMVPGRGGRWNLAPNSRETTTAS
jgi:hypothetical protein